MHDIFYFTDVHGQLDLFQTMRDWCLKQDPECMIVFGGDACDRGEFGYDIMEAILDDPQIVYIRGNHEDMFIRAAREAVQQYPEIANTTHTIAEANEIIGNCRWLHWFGLSMANGGRSTLKAWIIDGCKTEFVDRLEKGTCLTFELDNGVCFSHAGGHYDVWQRVYEDEYNGEIPDSDDTQHVIWDRNYLGAWWPENKTIVYGHTPTCYLWDYLPCFEDLHLMPQDEKEMYPIAYKPTTTEPNGWHIAMDTGMTFYGRGYVLNCLTMHIYGFLDRDCKKKDGKQLIEQFENYKII